MGKLKPIFIIILLAALFTTGCAKKSDNSPVSGGTIVIGYLYEPQLLNPLLDDYAATSDVVEPILPNFFTITPDMNYELDILEKEPTVENGGISPEPFKITYHIKKAASWNDGKPITSEDVKFTWQTVMNDKWEVISRTGYDMIEKIETPDQKTAVVTFKQPYAAWKELWSGVNYIYPKHVLDGQDINKVWNRKITVSGGPYMFKEWKQGQITLVKNDKYWGDKPNLDKLIFKYSDDSDTLVTQLKSGEVDIVNLQASPGMVDKLKKQRSITVKNRAGIRIEALGFNVQKPPLNDPNIRKAIGYSVDREKLIKAVMKDSAPLLQSIIVPDQKELFVPAWSKYRKDVKKAAELLQNSGYKKGASGYFEKNGKKLSLTISTTSGVPHREQIEQILQSELKDIGIDLVIKNTDPDTLYGTWFANGDYEISLSGWEASPDPSSNKDLFSGSQMAPEGQNVMRYSNETVTRLLDEQDSKIDPKERADMNKKIQELVAEDIPVLPLSQPYAILAFDDSLKGPDVNATIEGMLWNVGDWQLSK